MGTTKESVSQRQTFKFARTHFVVIYTFIRSFTAEIQTMKEQISETTKKIIVPDFKKVIIHICSKMLIPCTKITTNHLNLISENYLQKFKPNRNSAPFALFSKKYWTLSFEHTSRICFNSFSTFFTTFLLFFNLFNSIQFYLGFWKLRKSLWFKNTRFKRNKHPTMSTDVTVLVFCCLRHKPTTVIAILCSAVMVMAMMMMMVFSDDAKQWWTALQSIYYFVCLLWISIIATQLTYVRL